MRALKRWAAVVSLCGLAIGGAACGSSPEPSAVSAENASLGDEGGPIWHPGFLKQALAHITLRPEQKTQVVQMLSDAETRHQQIRAVRTALQTAVADQVQAGQISAPALKPTIDALLAAIDAALPADRAALVQLHDLLDSSQRNQLADAIERAHGGHDRHGRRERLEQLADELHLTSAQRDQIRSVLRDQFRAHREAGGEARHAAFEQMHQVIESFRGDTFAPPDDAGALAHDRAARGMDRMIGVLSAVVPVLSPEQRSIAAQKIRTRGAHL